LTRQINAAGLALIKQFEGLRLHAYQDGAGIWTIGYGHTQDVWKGDVCTPEDAERWLRDDLAEAEDAVSQLAKFPLTDNQFAALVAFTFNMGFGNLRRSNLLKHLNAGHYADVPEQLSQWVYVGSAKSPGLVARRAAEIALWNSSNGGSSEIVG
jgi:lysozyme